jgi:hypothetical protein
MVKKYSNIDELFRDKFKDFELYPPDHIWKKIKQQVQGSGVGKAGRSFSNGGIIGITLFLIITSLITIYLLQSTSGKDSDHELKVTNQNLGGSLNSTPRSAMELPSDKVLETAMAVATAKKDVQTENRNKVPSRFELIPTSKTQQGKSKLSVSESVNIAENRSLTHTEESDQYRQSEIPGLIPSDFNLKPGDDSELLALNDTDKLTGEQNKSNGVEEESDQLTESNGNEADNFAVPGPEIRDDYGKESNWKFGLYFTPELVYYPSAAEFNSRSYSLDLNAIYGFSGYLIQSGLGVGFSSDNGNYKIDYNKYLGAYQDVYDVTFDTTGGQVIPIYHTETVKVYDTIDRISISPTKRKFTYLNIPVLFGYGNEGRRFGWYVKAGPSLSVLIHENIPDINLTDSQNKILYVENELPGRIKTNWQFVFTGGVSYKLGNSLSFTLEPMFRYYINSAYEQNKVTLKTPYSIGIRAGFVLGF